MKEQPKPKLVAVPDAKPKASRISQSDVPAYSLQSALRVPQAIFENYASDPTTPLNVAGAMGMTPTSGPFRQLTGASIAYGLTEGGYNAPQIALTPLARQILAPLEEGADLAAKRDAFLRPRVISEFMSKYDGHAIPKLEIAHNVLVDMNVPRDRAERVLDLILDGARELGLLKEIKGKTYVNVAGADGVVSADAAERSSEQEDREVGEDEGYEDASTDITRAQTSPPKGEVGGVPERPTKQQANKRVFITHGKNKGFIEPIKKLLAFGEMEAVVSVERQSVSEPVPDKVMNEMRSCGAAIIHVDGEQVLVDQNANQQVVLNPNVLIEIGAAMALYGRRFVLLVRSGVSLPSNLQGLFEVRYEGDSLDGDATIRLLEAINQLKTVER